MTITYPDFLPKGLHSGRAYQVVDPMMRSALTSGRARQRRRFTDVPEAARIAWLFSSLECRYFEAWFRDVLTDGVLWFECPLKTPLGYQPFTCRFTGIYSGPTLVGPDQWSITAELEMQERAVLEPGWGEFPEFILMADIIDRAINDQWPESQWQLHMDVGDYAINQQWPSA